jgi:hypothetical protein
VARQLTNPSPAQDNADRDLGDEPSTFVQALDRSTSSMDKSGQHRDPCTSKAKGLTARPKTGYLGNRPRRIDVRYRLPVVRFLFGNSSSCRSAKAAT